MIELVPQPNEKDILFAFLAGVACGALVVAACWVIA